MIKLFYTGALSDGEKQSDGRRSLGGFISSTQVEGGMIDAVFAPISRGSDIEKENSACCFALYNDSDSAITADIYAQVERVNGEVILADTNAQGLVSTVKLAVEDPEQRSVPGLKSGAPLSFTEINRASSVPLFEFNSYSSEAPLVVPLDAKSYVGLWVLRVVSLNSLASNYTNSQLYFEHVVKDNFARQEDIDDLNGTYPGGFDSAGVEEINLGIEYNNS